MFSCSLLALFYESFPELNPSCGPLCSIPLTFEISLCPFLAFPIPSLLNVYPMATSLQYAPDKVQKILVGNKSDEVEKRQVATAQGIKVRNFIFTDRLWLCFCTLVENKFKRHYTVSHLVSTL